MCDAEESPDYKGSPRYSEVIAGSYEQAIGAIKDLYKDVRPRRLTDFELKNEDPIGLCRSKVISDFARFECDDYEEETVTEKSAYEYYIVRVMCDSESPVYFVHDETNDPFDEWDWEDVDWFISTSD